VEEDLSYSLWWIERMRVKTKSVLIVEVVAPRMK
jgi:hypothetical protein